MGDTMLYSCGIFRHEDESLEIAQERKLHTICKAMQMKPGEMHLDLGCGWGTFMGFAMKNYGVNTVGVTLSQ